MRLLYIAVLFTIMLGSSTASCGLADQGMANMQINKDTRCPVCGMFVAKYPNWLASLRLSDGSQEAFDGVKDMMAYYFSPQRYGAKKGVHATSVLVKDYYSQLWIDGKTALYVTGSDVLGPMGHELIPFETEDAAKNFLKDHHGKKILGFNQITEEMILAMKKGHKMKGYHMKPMKKM